MNPEIRRPISELKPSNEQVANDFREKLKMLELKAREFSDFLKNPENTINGNRGEVIAQSILAMRHLEDARMRFGKVIQYLGDGVSNFDK